MKLSFLVESLSGLLVAKQLVPGQEETEIRKVTSSVWQVEPGTLFVAVKGFSFDGGTLCGEAVKRGLRRLYRKRRVRETFPGLPSGTAGKRWRCSALFAAADRPIP